MPNLRPLRIIDSHEILNFFKFSGDLPANRGTVVRIESGWVADANPNVLLGAVGASFAGTLSERWGIRPAVTTCETGDTPLGITLYDVKETDENSQNYIFHRDKQDQDGVVLSGQAVPIMTRGVLLYSGVDGSPSAMQSLYASGGELTTSNAGSQVEVAKALGPKDGNGLVLVKVEL